MSASRADLIGMMVKTVADQQTHRNWTYRAVRPQTIPPTYVPAAQVWADCSDGARMLCRWAGTSDPAGTSYAPYGNSRSIWIHLPHVALSQAEPGDIFTFGYYAGEKHACMAWEKYGPGEYEWWVWNHGTQGQPVKRRLLDEIAGHRGMTLTTCRLPLPDLPQTPEEVLRAKQGFYAWVAWRLGEGENLWKPYGKMNPSVRPDVPKVISPLWWWNYRRFLAARKTADPATSKETP